MKEFHEILIEERPFQEFQFYCSKCNEVLIEVSDLTESPMKDEVLILHRIRNHMIETGHYSFDGNIKTHARLQNIDVTIEVNDV